MGTRLQARKLPASSEQQAAIESKLEIICANIANWQRDIDEEPITFEGVKFEYVELKGSFHSLYQEALYGRVTDKLSYDIISLISLIDRVKRATNRYIKNENRIENTTFNSIEPSNILAYNDINEMVSDLGVKPSDHNSPIIASGCSGFETLTGLVNPIGLGNLTVGLQVP